jgi:hypothetical protein
MIDPVMVTVIAGSISLITNVAFWNIRRLRCSHYEGWCCSCDRQIMTEEELKRDEFKNIMDNK